MMKKILTYQNLETGEVKLIEEMTANELVYGVDQIRAKITRLEKNIIQWTRICEQFPKDCSDFEVIKEEHQASKRNYQNKLRALNIAFFLKTGQSVAEFT